MFATAHEIYAYEYPALPPGQFRLVRLRSLHRLTSNVERPSPQEAALCAEFVETTFDDAVPYEAVSYCWTGHRREISSEERKQLGVMDRRIIIQSSEHSDRVLGFIPINSSLETALQYLQIQTDKPIFVDQICINQADFAEKAHLVARMGDIYAKADRVLAWLGPLTSEAAAFMSFMQVLDQETSVAFKRLLEHDYATLNQIRAAVVALDPDTVPIADSLKQDRDQLRELAVRIWDSLPLRGLEDIYSRQWFGRMWIIQEACLPRHLVFICGDRTCHVDDFERTALLCLLAVQLQCGAWTEELEKREYPKADDLSYIVALVRFANRILSVRRTLQREGMDRIPLFHIATRFNVRDTDAVAQTRATDLDKFRSGDPRDCYYSLLGLAKPDEVTLKQVVVDYSRPTWQVYTDYAAAVVQDYADVLLFSQNRCKRIEGLPSWVPDLSSELHAPYGYLNSNTPLFSAGVSKDGTPRKETKGVGVDGTTLVIPGYQVDVVERAGIYVYKMAASEGDIPTSQSLHYFLSEISLFCNLALKKENPPTISTGCRDEVAWLLSSGGRGMSPVPHQPPSSRFGPEIKGQRLLGAIHEIAKQQFARHTRVLERSAFAERMGAIEEPLLSKWKERQGLYYSLQNWLGIGNGWEEHEFYTKYNSWYRQFGEYEGPSEPEDGANLDPEVREAALLAKGSYYLALDRQVGRRCFITRDGYLGLGPEEMQAGDVVGVLKGVSVPVVLRPSVRSSEEGHFTYVGEAYCHGIMDGELLGALGGRTPLAFRIA
ncbi:hypothetical protein BU26DRAFT_231225 [Trematosphaeria pertusa]|uniref:Heterokaryon incompatibility domain-containing protein n=1 Tax=Trematosphaeria pertusa TaxID=390896 RepID=A0A6A6ITZ9_9PLEO|nr:uncharacterized protein BU26DRAFT_231225 [Trematosphaeria pertusa]KAF2253886.1 hypothetical protein BU26DRAFT_231225 [Trematosphaeria pertusa]